MLETFDGVEAELLKAIFEILVPVCCLVSQIPHMDNHAHLNLRIEQLRELVSQQLQGLVDHKLVERVRHGLPWLGSEIVS